MIGLILACAFSCAAAFAGDVLLPGGVGYGLGLCAGMLAGYAAGVLMS